MKFLYIIGLLLLIVNSSAKSQKFLQSEDGEAFNPDTKYFIYNKATSRCIKRALTNNGYTDYYITTIGECTEDDDNLWYIRGSNIVSAATEFCLAVVNFNSLGAKDCKKSVIEAVYFQDFDIEDNTICSKQDNCLKDHNGQVGLKKNKDKYYEWVISTLLPK